VFVMLLWNSGGWNVFWSVLLGCATVLLNIFCEGVYDRSVHGPN
jgi:hypothetical protein